MKDGIESTEYERGLGIIRQCVDRGGGSEDDVGKTFERKGGFV